MSDLNTVQVYGHLTADADLQKAENGNSVLRFSIATNKVYRNENGELKKTVDFFPFVVFGTYADNVASYLTKGTGVIVSGSLRQHKWEKDGVKRNTMTVSVRRIQIVSTKKKQPEETVEEESFDIVPEMPLIESDNYDDIC